MGFLEKLKKYRVPIIILLFTFIFLAMCLASSMSLIVYNRDKITEYISPTLDPYIMVEGDPTINIPDSEKVAVYDSNTTNPIATFIPGKFILTDVDNMIVSLKVPSGYEVHLYDDNNFKKELAVYKKDTILPPEVQYKTSSISIAKI